MVCGQCGDPLIKVPLIKTTQIFALIVTSAFIAPLILMVFGYLKEIHREERLRELTLRPTTTMATLNTEKGK